MVNRNAYFNICHPAFLMLGLSPLMLKKIEHNNDVLESSYRFLALTPIWLLFYLTCGGYLSVVLARAPHRALLGCREHISPACKHVY